MAAGSERELPLGRVRPEREDSRRPRLSSNLLKKPQKSCGNLYSPVTNSRLDSRWLGVGIRPFFLIGGVTRFQKSTEILSWPSLEKTICLTHEFYRFSKYTSYEMVV